MALPTPSGAQNYHVRGTVATQYDNHTQRVEVEQMLHAIFLDLRFYNEDWMEKQTIPRKQNEKVYWEIDAAATGAVYQVNEFGKQVGGVNNSAGAAQVADAEIVGHILNMSTVEGTIKRYASAFFYTRIAQSVSRRDPVVWGETKMGEIVATQLDALAKGVFDAWAQDVYPRAAITADNSAAWATTDVFNYAYVLKLEVYLDTQGFKPPKGASEYPVILPLDAIANLLLDTTTAALLRETAQRKDPMAGVFAKDYIGTLRKFRFYTSNRLTAVAYKNDASVTGGRGYIFTAEAVGVMAMDDPDYGQMPNGSGNSNSQDANREWTEMPRPVNVFHHEPGNSGLADLLKDKGAIAEVHTLGFRVLQPGRLIRFAFATGTGMSGDIGLNVTAPTGSLTMATGHRTWQPADGTSGAA